MSNLAEQTKKRIKNLGNDQQIIGFVKDVKLQELLEEIDRLEWELDEKENPLGVFRGVIFSIPFALLSDTSKKVIRSYGVDGPFGLGVRRVSYLIDRGHTITNRVVSDLFVGPHTDLLSKIPRGGSKPDPASTPP